MKIWCVPLLLFPWSGDAQISKVDSLEQMVKLAKSDTSRSVQLSFLADELTKTNPALALQKAREGLRLALQFSFTRGAYENCHSLASAFQGQAAFDSAVYYFHRALALAVKAQNESWQAEMCSGLGHPFMRKSEMDSARFYLNQGLSLAQKIKATRIEAGIYNNYGNVFLEESNNHQALEYFVKAARLYEHPLGDAYGQCLALSNIGNVEYRLGNYERALDYAQQSMHIAQEHSFTSSIGYAHKLLGRTYRKLKDYDSAIEHYKQGQQVYSTLDDARSVSEILLYIGNIYFDKLQFQTALGYYQHSLRVAKRNSLKSITAYNYSAIGQAFVKLSQYKKAIPFLDSAQTAAAAIDDYYLVLDTYQAMEIVHEAQGDFKKALAIQKKIASLNDSLTLSDNRKLTEEIQAKYELEKKESQIVLLQKDRELKNLDINRMRAIQAGVLIAVTLMFIIGMLLINRYRLGNRAKRMAEIEQVRNVIARDLHDDIGSTLTTIHIISKLAINENPKGKDIQLTRIADQSARMMESMGDIVWSINPANDTLEKVIVKMKVTASEILEPRNISYHFDGNETWGEFTLNAQKRKNLFLIYKEALNNAAKYSQANQMEINVHLISNKILALTIEDNGQGFDLQTAKQGNGIRNMYTRAHLMGAQFELTTALGKGTKLQLELPLT